MNGKRFDVYGIGNAITDLQLQVEDEDLKALGLEKGTMKLVDPAVERQLLDYFGSRDLNRASGGSAANTMISLAQLGARAAYGCVVGDDANGRFYFSEMADLGVALHTTPLPNRRTGTSIILITPDAERTMNTHLGASVELDGSHVSEEFVRGAEWIYVEGYLFAAETGRDAASRAIELAKRNGAKVAITFSDTFIIDVFGDALREAVASADLVFANRNEAKKYVGVDDEERAFDLLCSLAPAAVMTLGERGARVSMNGSRWFIEPFPAKAIDDTGAGDMFAGGFLFGITQGMTPPEAGRLACFLASKVVAQLGPRIRGDVNALVRGEGFTAGARAG